MSLRPHKLKILALILALAMAPVVVNVLVHEWPLPDPVAPDKFDYHHDRLGTVMEDMIEAGRQAITAYDKTWWARGATTWYASASGSGTTCSIGTPCSLYTAMCGTQCSAFNPQPGDTIYVRGGTYTANTNPGTIPSGYELRQNGSAGNPITYRRYAQEHAFIDCKGTLNPSSLCMGQAFWNGGVGSGNYVTVWGLDWGNTSTQARITNDAPSQPCAGSDTCQPTDMNEIFIKATGVQIINNFFSDQIDGLQWASGGPGSGNPSGLGQTAKVERGNVKIYSGYCGTTQRCYGHSGYVQNYALDGVPGRSFAIGNIGLRAFDVGTQWYTHGNGVGYITGQYNAEIANGHAIGTTAWPAISCCDYNLYLGAAGGVATSCTISSFGDLLYNDVYDSNVSYGGANGMEVGGTKGACNLTLTNNYFAFTGAVTFLANGIFAPLTITGNTFMATPSNTGGPAALFTAANYPTNTYLPGLPIAGTQTFYHVNDDEVGIGKVEIFNWGNTPTVSVNLDSMGCFAGEQYQLMNYQDPNPWTGHTITTGTCVGTGDVVVVSATTSNIQQPGFTTDGSTLFPKPPDLGPTFVGFILFPNVSAGAGTPTPTNTVTLTPTLTSTTTRTNTSTPTFTPTITRTPTPTSGTATATFTLTPTFTQTFTPTITNTPTRTFTVTPTPTANPLTFGVTACTAEPPMGITPDAGALSGHYATSTVTNQGDLVCPFTVPVTGLYRVWVHVSATTASGDSFFLDVDGDNGFNSLTPTPTPAGNTPTPTLTPTAPTHLFDTQERSQPCSGFNSCTYQSNGWTGAYIWNIMNDATATCGNCSGRYTERDLTLSAGSHTITFRNREDLAGASAHLDYFILTTDFNFDPSGFGTPTPTPTATPTPSGRCPYTFVCKHNSALKLMAPCNQPVKNPCAGQ